MKNNKILALAIVAIIGVSLLAGCSSTKNDRAKDINSLNMNEVERLPEEMQEDPINKTLAEMRDLRRNSYSEEDGEQNKIGVPDQNISGQTKNRPEYSYDELSDIFNVIQKYVESTAKVPKRGYGYDIAQCIDPRMNAIYDDEDKGVATGYENKNIFIAEYETAEDAVYSYLVLVRDSKSGSWKIIYDGLSYKEKAGK
jgi:outer membrane murein-binding lipoprotein Lpp